MNFARIAALAAVATLGACSTVQRTAGALWPFDNQERAPSTSDIPQEGRISILAFEQELTPDPTLQSRHISPPPAVQMADWSQPGGTADNSPPNASGVAELQHVFRTGLGAGSNNRVKLAAPPVIADGRLFFLDADHRLHSVGADDGHRIWTRELRPHHTRDRVARGGGVAVANGRVFVTTGFGFMVALNAETGEEIWRTETTAPFHSAPTVAGGHVFAITNDSELISYDAASGEMQWNHQAIAEPARILSASSVAYDGETVIAPFASGELVALLAANGRRIWSDSLSRTGRLTSLSAINDIAGRPVIDNGVAYAASHSGVLAAIDIRTGQRIWARAFASTQTPFVAGDVLYAVSVDGELAAFDRTTGNIYWVKQLRRFENERERKGRIAWTGPIMVGSRLVLANSLGDVVSVNPADGDIVAQTDVGQPIFIPPIAAHDHIYVVTDDARLVVLR